MATHIKLSKRGYYTRSVEIFNYDESSIIFSSMTEAARALNKCTAIIYAMMANGNPRFL